MRLLVDSHILLWLLFESKRLSDKARLSLEDADSVAVSMATLWELSIKYSKGKLKYPPQEIYDSAIAAGLQLMPIKGRHIIALPNFKLPHGDPFDQLLIAQSEAEGYSFLTADKQLLKSKYHTVAA